MQRFAPCSAVPSAAPRNSHLAVLLAGEVRQLSTATGINRAALFLRNLGRQYLEVFLHLGQHVTKRSCFGGCISKVGNMTVAQIVDRLSPAWWAVEEDLLHGFADPCQNTTSTRLCVAHDVGAHNHSVGCYVRGCKRCDARKYYRQFGRLLHSYVALRDREKACHLSFAYIMRLRTDLIGRPPGNIRWPNWHPVLVPRLIYTGGSWRHGGHRDAWTPTDMWALVPRALGARFFSLALAFVYTCQAREVNAATCGYTWDWATPECIYKVHLQRCIGLEQVNTTFGLPSRSPPASTRRGTRPAPLVRGVSRVHTTSD